MYNGPVSVLSLRLNGLPLVLRNELEDVDGELLLGDSFFRTVAVPSVRVTVRVCDVLPAAVAGPLGGARVSASPAPVSLRYAQMVADWTFSAYFAAIRSATGSMYVVKCL